MRTQKLTTSKLKPMLLKGVKINKINEMIKTETKTVELRKLKTTQGVSGIRLMGCEQSMVIESVLSFEDVKGKANLAKLRQWSLCNCTCIYCNNYFWFV